MGLRDLFFNITAKDLTAAAFKSVRDSLRGIDGALAGTAQKLDRTGRSMQSAGRSMSILSAATAFVGNSLAGTAGNFEADMLRLSAVSSATTADFTAMRDMAADLGITTKFSAGEAAQSMQFLAMAGFDVNEILSATPAVLQLAAASNMDLAISADIVSNVLTGYQMTAADLARVNDVLVTTTVSSNTTIDQLGVAFKYVGPVARATGLEIEYAAAIIGKLGDAGIQGEMAGTALRGALTKLLNPSREAQNALADLGVTVHDANGALLPFDQILRDLEPHADNAGAMMEIFGQRAGPAMLALLSQGVDGLDQLNTKLLDSAGTAARIAKQQMQGLNAAKLMFKSAWDGLAVALGDSGVLDSITSLVNAGADLVRWMADLEPWILRTGAAFAGLVVVGAPLLLLFGSLSIAVAAISAPLLAVVAGISGLTAAAGFLLPKLMQTAAATDNITLAMGDEIKQTKLLTSLLGSNTEMSVAAAEEKLAEALARHENVAAIIAEQRALALNGEQFKDLSDQIKDSRAALSALGFPANDAVSLKNADAYHTEELRLADLITQRQNLLKADDKSAAQLAETEKNIAKLRTKLDAAKNGVVSFGAGLNDPIIPPDRVLEIEDLTAKLRGLYGELNKPPGVFDGIGEDTAGLLKDVFTGARHDMNDFADFATRWADNLLNRFLTAAFNPMGDAIQSIFDTAMKPKSDGGGGGLSGMIGALTGGLLSFDTGADFIAGGRGGIDRNVAAFKVSAGERVTVTPRGGGGSTRPVIVNIHTPNPASFKASAGQVSAQIARAVGAGRRLA